MVAPCLLGVEGIVGGELKRMDARDVSPENGRVFFSGGEEILARANIRSRYSERICIVMGRFRAETFDSLFEQTKALPWERWIGKTDAFPVKGSSLNSKLYSVPDCQKIIKKAIVDRLASRYHLPWLEETGVKKQVQFLIMKDMVCLMADTTGEGLHKRGYRRNGAVAPIKETLAASMADIAFVRDYSNVVDPCCGTGTILIESAMKAANLAPGMLRRFAAESFPEIPSRVWREERALAGSLVKKGIEFTARGYDIDPDTLETARHNARIAGVDSMIEFELRDIKDFRQETEKGVVICNPPYGERLMDIDAAREIYGAMGEVFERRNGWSYSIISPDEQFETCFGRRADKRRKLYNGMIRCQLYTYYK